MDQLKQWARILKNDVMALWIAGRDARTPLVAKILALLTAAYALSPIDLIPDFIPVLGYLDDLLLVPLGIAMAIRLIPRELLAEFRAAAASRPGRPKSYIAAAIIVLLWIALLFIIGLRMFSGAP